MKKETKKEVKKDTKKDTKKEVKKETKKIDFKKTMKQIKIILFISMIVLIYIASPRIAILVKELANYVYNVDNNTITRIVEIILAVLSVAILSYKRK